MSRKDKASKGFLKKWHRWVGLLFSVFVINFCISGIILNHRDLFSCYDVCRTLLPKSYAINNYNNGIIKGTLSLADDSLLCWGVSGCFIADKGFNTFRDCNNGFDKGVDNRKICQIVRDKYNNLIAAAQKDVFIYDTIKSMWQKINLEGNKDRMTDVVVKGDTLFMVSRSNIYQSVYPYNEVKCKELKVPLDYKNRVSLFKTVWHLHSGALFGITGRIIVDILGIVLIFLSLSGIIYFFLPYHIRNRVKNKKQVKKESAFLRFNAKYHKKIGYKLIILTVLMALTGMCLRPPLMVPLVLNSTKALKFTALDNPNPFADKLRALRYDEGSDSWLISTSEGFYTVKDLDNDSVVKIDNSPGVSPMGINVFEKNDDGTWLIGSFSGMYKWDIAKGKITDYFTGEIYKPVKGRPVGRNMISGISRDINDKTVVFTYDRGALEKLPQVPHILSNQPISLWNVALELHTGRLYTAFPEFLSVMFIFLSGVVLLLILISGYIIMKKRKNKHIQNIHTDKAEENKTVVNKPKNNIYGKENNNVNNKDIITK